MRELTLREGERESGAMQYVSFRQSPYRFDSADRSSRPPAMEITKQRAGAAL